MPSQGEGGEEVSDDNYDDKNYDDKNNANKSRQSIRFGSRPNAGESTTSHRTHRSNEDAAAFIKATEGVRKESWQGILDETGTTDPRIAADTHESAMARGFKQLIRTLDDGESESTFDSLKDGSIDRRCSYLRKAAIHAAFAWDPDDSGPTRDSGAPPSTGELQGSNFCATGSTETPQSTATTAPLRDDTVHVAVQWELEDNDATCSSTQLSDSSMQQLDAESKLLHIPYRSMSARLKVEIGNTLQGITVVIDSGAAQSAVSSRWLKSHPQLWDSRTSSPHRFHGITGERLHTDGVVRLRLKLGEYWMETWAHVFTGMKSDMLLGTNALVENSLMLDCADCTLYPKAHPSQVVPVDYRLVASNGMLHVSSGDARLQSTQMSQHTRSLFNKVPRAKIPVTLLKSVTLPPAAHSTDGAEGALPFQLAEPYFGNAQNNFYVSADALRHTHPHLSLMDAQMSCTQTMGYFKVSNHGDAPLVLPAGMVVGYASATNPRTRIISDEDGVGRLAFRMQLATPEAKPQPVTEENLRDQRGLDLSDCRDLGRPGAPLLDATQKQELVAAFVDMEKAISVDPKRPGTSDYMLIRINTGDAPPQASKPYSIPYAYQEYVRKEIEKLLSNGLISPCTSSWASPVLVVIKKDHTGENVNIKLATDLRKLNAVTEMDTGAIGEMHEILDKFHGRPYVSCCDVSSGYYSFLIHPDDRHKLCFVLPMSMGGTTFCWNRAPYGVARLPAEFSRAIMTILDGTQEDISSYIDDLTVHTATFKQHVRALRVMMRRLILAGVCLKGSKCLVLPPRLELLGFDVTPQGVHKQKKKCREFKDYPTPTSREEIQKYLGGVQFYRRFVDNLATIAAPLTDLLKKNKPWTWQPKHQTAFDTLNELLYQDIALSFPDLKDPRAHYWVFTDASDVAVAAILMQLQYNLATGEYEPRTIAHFSRVLDDTQRKWAIYEKESCALMLAVTHWRKYLLGRPFSCFVDSSVALTMLSKQRHTPKMQRWGLLLQEYMPGMSVSFKRSEENGGSDSLSRKASFAQYVPQPKDCMPLNDSLYDRLYEVDTSVRGKFGLYKPKDPLKLSEMWGVAFDAIPTETIATVHTTDDMPNTADEPDVTVDDADVQCMMAYAVQEQLPLSDDKVAERLLHLAETMVATWLDPARRAVASDQVHYEQLVSHYTKYVDAFVATEGRRPLIHCMLPTARRNTFSVGCEMAGCVPVTGSDVQVQGIYADGDIAVTDVQRAAYTIGDYATVQMDGLGGLHACNFDVHDVNVQPQVSGYHWRQCAAAVLERRGCAFQRGLCEQSHPGAYVDRSASSDIMHGQLLCAQMVAAYMHRKHGMPLWSAADVVHHPSRTELLKQWTLSGFRGRSKGETHDEHVWHALVQQVQVLQRPLSPPQSHAPAVPDSPTWVERMQRYTSRSEELDRVPRPRPQLRQSQQDEELTPGKRAFAQDTYPAPGEPLSERALRIAPQKAEGEESGIVGRSAYQNSSQIGLASPSEVALPLAQVPESRTESPISPITSEEQDADPTIAAVKQLLQCESAVTTTQSRQAAAAKANFVIAADGLLKHRSTPLHQVVEKQRVVVPHARRHALLEAYHTSPIYGHRGYQTLYELLSKHYFWSGMYSDCVDFVSRCEVCAVRKPFHSQYASEVKARPTPSRPFHTIALDIKGPLITTDNNNSYILVVVCLLTRFVVAVPLPNTNQVTIARALMDHVFCVHGFSHNIQVDNAAYFKGTTMKALTELFGIRLISVLPFQPTSNGQAEAMVKSISNALQRNGNALRSWDTMLQLVVHGINCTETNHLGMTPFHALFGRDPVGLAELEWPDLQRLDTDGDTFVSDLAARIRSIWSDLKATSDEVKRQAAERANAEHKQRHKRPLRPGDYVFVEHGDQEHSKRLGKAGLPRRRRFKVLEYHPDRGYVKIDTDGYNLIDKVSLNRIMRAPTDYSVVDNSVPITKVERRGQLDMPLPPGWKAVLKHGATKDYQEYVGPGGKGKASTPVQAWREFNGDPVYMPQPAVPAPRAQSAMPPSAKVPMLPSLYAKVPPSTPAPSASSSLTDKAAATLEAVMAEIRRLQHEHVGQSCTVHGWKVAYTPRPATAGAPRQGDFYATSPEGKAYRSLKSIRAHFASQPPSTPTVRVCPVSELRPGQRIRVKWADPDEEFAGTIKGSTMEGGQRVHQILYDDGITCYHNLARESWILLDAGEPSHAQVMSIQAVLQRRGYHRRVHTERLQAIRKDHCAARAAYIVAFLDCSSAFGLELSS